jgi:hypothetical protein
MVQDQALVPADLRDIRRDVPSRPATVLGVSDAVGCSLPRQLGSN